MEVYRLENDLTMYYTRIPTAQSIAIGMYVKCGSQNEIKQQNGISHMLEHMHFRRLGQMYSDEIYHETESMGATLSAVTYKDFTKYEMKIRPRFLPKATQLFRLLIEHDTWNSEDLESERIIVRREMLEKTAYFDLDYYVDRFYAITEPDLLELAKHIFQLCNLSVLIDGAPTKLTNTSLRQFLSDHFDM